MENILIKEELQKYIDAGDEKLLRLMYAVAKEYTETDDEYELNDEQIVELDRRRSMRVSGESKVIAGARQKKL